MTEAEAQALMQRHGIAAVPHAVYHFRDFKYSSLQDAVNYAEQVASRESGAPGAETRDSR
jgi:hypothetical protein